MTTPHNAIGPESQGHSSEQPCKVGPGRPPKEHQFKPGTSGNPGGRKKGETFKARLRRILETEHNGKEIADLLMERLVKDALSGKLGHLKELLDRTEGKVTERVELVGDQDQRLVINIVEAL